MVLSVITPGQYTVTAAPAICPDYLQSLGLTLEVLFIECTTGVSEKLSTNKKVLVYPNPTVDQITLKSEGEEILDIIIYNSAGQLISREVVSNNLKTIDISRLSPGIYIMEINKKNEKERHTFLIN